MAEYLVIPLTVRIASEERDADAGQELLTNQVQPALECIRCFYFALESDEFNAAATK